MLIHSFYVLCQQIWCVCQALQLKVSKIGSFALFLWSTVALCSLTTLWHNCFADTVPVNKKFTFRFKRTIVLRCESFRSVTVFLSSFLTSVFVGIIRRYIRTIYTHVTKHPALAVFAKIVWVSSVNLKTAFTCYSKQRILVHYGKGYKATRRYSSDLKVLRSLSPNGFTF